MTGPLVSQQTVPEHTIFYLHRNKQNLSQRGKQTKKQNLSQRGKNKQTNKEFLIISNLESSREPLEKEMATHSSILAWRTPGTGEPGGLPSMGLHRVGHD